MTLTSTQLAALACAWGASLGAVAYVQYRRLLRCRRWAAGAAMDEAKTQAELAKRREQLAKIQTVELAEFDPAFVLDEFGPTRASEVSFIFRGDYRVLGGTSDLEAWVLAVLAKQARVLFEFGTCTGKTTYLWARNSPPDARIATLTLGPDQVHLYQGARVDDGGAEAFAREESAFARFLYTGTDVEHKIEQIFADSKQFDESPYVGRCDLIFVDGSHARSYVQNDSEKALRMVRPGGIILWHDYSMREEMEGLVGYLQQLRGRLPLVHLAGTTLVAYRAPAP